MLGFRTSEQLKFHTNKTKLLGEKFNSVKTYKAQENGSMNCHVAQKSCAHTGVKRIFFLFWRSKFTLTHPYLDGVGIELESLTRVQASTTPPPPLGAVKRILAASHSSILTTYNCRKQSRKVFVNKYCVGQNGILDHSSYKMPVIKNFMALMLWCSHYTKG